MAQEGSTKSVLVAMAANGAIAVAKFAGAAISGSASMLAEAFHSVADTGNEILLYVGIKRARKPADAAHPFGYGRERYFWSFVVAIALFLIGGAFSIVEGVEKLIGGEHGDSGILIPLVVLVVAAGFEGYSFSVAYRNFNKTRGGKPFFTAIKQTKDPTIITVLCEDSAALVGLAIAAAGIVLTYVTHNPLFDALGSILIGLLLTAVAFFLGSESKSLLIGESANLEHRRAITKICRSKPEVLDIIELITMQVSPDDILVNLHLQLQPKLTMRQVEKLITSLEHDIHAEVDTVRRVVIEPRISEYAAAKP